MVSTDVLPVKALLDTDLEIPDYQRPYKWQAAHVNQLLDDLAHHQHKEGIYRLGTVVLHQDLPGGSQGIVDGQQRLLTLAMICHLLDPRAQSQPKLLGIRFQNTITKQNLQHNAAVIEARLRRLTDTGRAKLLGFLHHRCEFVRVILDDLSEAFQFFDSQNARGKELAPYDLLKAFHLREMAHDGEAARMQCVSRWEAQVSPQDDTPSLRLIMSDVLYRIRRWSSDNSGLRFSRNNIAVFKGVSLRNDDYGFARPLRALDYMVDQYNSDAVRHWDRQRMVFPFAVNQVLINGRRFFEYVQNYVELYSALFIKRNSQLQQLLKLLDNYEGRHRTGDKYVRNLFECVLLFYCDRFGDRDLEQVGWLCFLWSYRIRLEQQRVVQESIDNTARSRNSLFRVIQQALHSQEVLAFTQEPILKIEATKVDALVAEFQNQNAIQEARNG